MKILILGATGFVGRHLTQTLQHADHEVIRGVRKLTLSSDIAVDFSKDTDKAVWLPRLKDIDAVVNVVGVLRDTPSQPMLKLHEQAPLALFAACKEVGIKRIVQGSALGVDQGIETPYFQTRRAAEAFLNKHFEKSSFTLRQGSPEQSRRVQGERTLKNTVRAEPVEEPTTTENPNLIRYLILRPSVIFGEDGASAKMFRLQASLPVHALPAGGVQKLQPVHIDDICEAVNNWLVNPDAESQIVACVGAEATDMRGMLDSYRQQLGKANAVHISIPYPWVKLAAKMGDFIPASPLCNDTLTMLMAGNTADSTDFARLLGRPPKSYQTFVSGVANHDHA